MKIEGNLKTERVSVSQIVSGQVFEHYGDLYLKTVNRDDETTYFCVRLTDGYCRWFHDSDFVRLCGARVIVDG
jgi:hypothetical protein